MVDEPDDATGVSITGQISNVTDIQVIGATVNFISSSQTYTTVTNANGEFDFSGIPEGTYKVTIEAPGYDLKTEENVTVTSGAILPFDILGKFHCEW